MNSIFFLSLKLTFSRIKWVILLTFSLSIVLASVTSILIASDNIKGFILNSAFKQYGEFSGVIKHSTEWKANGISKPKSLGRFYVTEEIRITEHEYASVGWADRQFVDIGHLSLLVGEFPTLPNEVAIESYYLDRIDPLWEVGEQKRISMADGEQMFKLVGIVENYSATWSAGTDRFKFPNIFVHESSAPKDMANFLVGYNPKISTQRNLENFHMFLENYQGNGFLNDRLFYNGLRDYNNITKINYGSQFMIVFATSFSVLTMLSFFYYRQATKFAIFKAIGAANDSLRAIAFCQAAIIYIMGMFVSVPLSLLFRYVIIRNTYQYDINLSLTLGTIINIIIVWAVLFLVVFGLMQLAIRRERSINISFILRGGDNHTALPLRDQLSRIRSFRAKQLVIQILTRPKEAILLLLTISFSILAVVFSYISAQESAGVWETDIDYYLSSHEFVGTKVINDKQVVITDGENFPPSDVRKLEALKGISYIDKLPFMLDVSLQMDAETLTPSLSDWLRTNNGYTPANEGKVFIPEVNYVLKSIEELKLQYPDIPEEELHDSVMIHIPGATEQDSIALIGTKITLEKTNFENEEIHYKNWEYRIADVLGNPYSIDVEESHSITKEGITIVMNEEGAISRGITSGYKDLMIYTENQLSSEEEKFIYNNVYTLIAGTPGGLFQYVPEVIHNSTRITDFLDFLSRFAFYISILIAITAITTLAFCKYQIQKKYWGIYRALGMNSNSIFTLLLLEIFAYFIIASVISYVSLSLFFVYNHTTHPSSLYFQFLTLTILSVFSILIVASLLLKQKIKNDSISSLLRTSE